MLPYGKNFCGRPWLHWFWSNSWVIKWVAVWFLLCHSKTINAKVISLLNLCTNRSNLNLYNFDAWLNSLKNMKNQQKSVLIFKREAPKSAKPRAFGRFAQWLIRPWMKRMTLKYTICRWHCVETTGVFGGSLPCDSIHNFFPTRRWSLKQSAWFYLTVRRKESFHN